MPTCSRCRKNVTPTAEGYCPSCAEPFEEAAHRGPEPGGQAPSGKRPLGVTILAWINLLFFLPWILFFPLFFIFSLAGGGSAIRGSHPASLVIYAYALGLAQIVVAIGLLRGWGWARWTYVAIMLLGLVIFPFMNAGGGAGVLVGLVVVGIQLAVLSSREASLHFDGGEHPELDYRPWSRS